MELAPPKLRCKLKFQKRRGSMFILKAAKKLHASSKRNSDLREACTVLIQELEQKLENSPALTDDQPEDEDTR